MPFKRIFLAIVMLIAHRPAAAQAWQWGARGGGSSDGWNTSPYETVTGMATDRNGNVYFTGTVEASGAPSVGSPSNYLATYGNKDIVVSSFSCNGTHRWSRVIGGAGDDFAGTIGTDSLGHVYVIGQCTPQTTAGREIHFSNDTIQPASVMKSTFLIQYDTLGRFQWLRQPTADTVSISGGFSNSGSFDLQVDPNGDVYWLVMMSAGLVSGGSGGWTTSMRSMHILKYDVRGVLTDHVAPQLDMSRGWIADLQFARSRTGRYVFCGNVDFQAPAPGIGNTTIGHVMFLACFDSRGRFLWKKENTLKIQSTRIFSKPAIDVSGNIYYCGIGERDDVFNGHKFLNAFYGGYLGMRQLPFLGKADSNGNHIWIRNAGGKGSGSRNSIVLKNQHEIWLSGTAYSMYWTPAMFVQSEPNGGTSVYVARFEAGGSILSLDSLKGVTAGENLAMCNATDKAGNLIAGGMFNVSLNVRPGTTLLNTGGYSDLFIAKYGFPCSCATQPVASYTAAVTGVRTARFSYSGTATGIDSLVWTWGDGQRQMVKTGLTTPLNYTYATPGAYTACANIFSSCGTASFCGNITIANAAAAGGTRMIDDVTVYPDPAGRYLQIEGASGLRAALLSSLGQQLIWMQLESSAVRMDLAPLPAGVYLLQLRDRSGNMRVMRISKTQ